MQPDDLAKFLRDDERSGIEAFREQFLEALDHRDLNTCEFLLASIEGISSAPVQHMKSHFQALLFAELRQFDRAESMLRELLEENLSADQKPRTLMELANQLDEQGAGPEAEHYLREALAAFERIGDRRGQAWVLNNHAISITFQIEQGLYVNARLDEAIALHLKAIEIATELDDTDEVARNLHGLGKIYGLRGDYDRAQIEFGHYLAWGRLAENEHDIGFTLSDMAALALQPQGKMAQAKAALDEAIVLLQHSDDDLDLAEAYTRRGKLLEAVGDDDAALEDLNRGVRHAELQRARLAVPITRVGYRATADFIYTALVSHYLRRGLLMDAFTAAEQARARVLADLLASQIDRQAPIQSELAALRSELTQQVEAARADKKPEHEVTILERELAGVNRRIELTASVHATLGATKSLTAEDVQRRLPEASALLSYMVDAQDELWILVLTKSTIQAVHIKNLTLRWLQNYLVEYLDGIYRGELVPQPATGRLRPAKILTLLFQSLLEPVLDTLLRSRTTYIIPTGALHYIPLAALSPKVGEPPPLLAADRRVVYAPSATILLQHGGGHSMPNGRTSLAVAPGTFDLRFVEESALAIASSTTGKSLVGSEATRSQFIKEAIHARRLYFLGHAYFNGRYPMSSRLQLSDGPLSASEMLQTLCLEADLVVLASCESGRSAIPRGDEIMGLVRAFLYAGARSLLVTLWPVHEVPTRLLVERLVQTLQVMEQAGRISDPAQALAEAQNWLRGLTVSDVHRLVSKWTVSTSVEMTSLLTELWRMTHSEKEPIPGDRLFSHPFFWSAFILIGETPVDPDLS